MIKTTLVALFMCTTISISAQETIPASGGDAIGSGGSSSYSVGQIVYTTNTGSGTVSQGVQHSVEIFVLSNPDLETVNLNAITYPNPTTDYVVLALTDASLINLTYKLFDIHGRVISNGKVHEEHTQIAMQNFPSGVYILKVNQNNKALKTFKIIKK